MRGESRPVELAGAVRDDLLLRLLRLLRLLGDRGAGGRGHRRDEGEGIRGGSGIGTLQLRAERPRDVSGVLALRLGTRLAGHPQRRGERVAELLHLRCLAIGRAALLAARHDAHRTAQIGSDFAVSGDGHLRHRVPSAVVRFVAHATLGGVADLAAAEIPHRVGAFRQLASLELGRLPGAAADDLVVAALVLQFLVLPRIVASTHEQSAARHLTLARGVGVAVADCLAATDCHD